MANSEHLLIFQSSETNDDHLLQYGFGKQYLGVASIYYLCYKLLLVTCSVVGLRLFFVAGSMGLTISNELEKLVEREYRWLLYCRIRLRLHFPQNSLRLVPPSQLPYLGLGYLQGGMRWVTLKRCANEAHCSDMYTINIRAGGLSVCESFACRRGRSSNDAQGRDDILNRKHSCHSGMWSFSSSKASNVREEANRKRRGAGL